MIKKTNNLKQNEKESEIQKKIFKRYRIHKRVSKEFSKIELEVRNNTKFRKKLMCLVVMGVFVIKYSVRRNCLKIIELLLETGKKFRNIQYFLFCKFKIVFTFL